MARLHGKYRAQVEQRSVVVVFPAGDRVGARGQPQGLAYLLVGVDKVVHFQVIALLAYTSSEHQPVGGLPVGLGKRGYTINAVAGIAAYGVGRIQDQPPAVHCGGKVEQGLVCFEGLMLEIDSVVEADITDLAAEDGLEPGLCGVLLGRGEVTARHVRERMEIQALLAMVELHVQAVAEQFGGVVVGAHSQTLGFRLEIRA